MSDILGWHFAENERLRAECHEWKVEAEYQKDRFKKRGGELDALDEQIRVLIAERDGIRVERDAAVARAALFEVVLFRTGAMEIPPCFKCGYNGPNYYQPAAHPCAATHHALKEEKKP